MPFNMISNLQRGGFRKGVLCMGLGLIMPLTEEHAPQMPDTAAYLHAKCKNDCTIWQSVKALTNPCAGLLDVLLACLLKAAQVRPGRGAGPGTRAAGQASRGRGAPICLEFVIHKDLQPYTCTCSVLLPKTFSLSHLAVLMCQQYVASHIVLAQCGKAASQDVHTGQAQGI
jgi:hypothetical protein